MVHFKKVEQTAKNIMSAYGVDDVDSDGFITYDFGSGLRVYKFDAELAGRICNDAYLTNSIDWFDDKQLEGYLFIGGDRVSFELESEDLSETSVKHRPFRSVI